MDNLEVVIEKRHATKRNLAEISRIVPDAKITVYNIQKRYPIISKVRGGFRRISLFEVFNFLPQKLDELADEQKLVWIAPPVNSTDGKKVLLFPPLLERQVAKRLVQQLNPGWIHSITAGLDRLPSIPRSTRITNSRGIYSLRIAEFTMGLIFSLAKNIPEHVKQNKKRTWRALPSNMVEGARLGIVGLGSIGTEIARVAKKCGMEVWATKRKMAVLDYVDCLLPAEKLPELLREVDYVVIAVPLTRETYHFIGKAELDMMKSAVCLINISRGALVDEDALYDALKNKRIRGACIDVFKDEKPLPKSSRFYKLPNILITSYSAYYSVDWIDQVMEFFFNNLERFVSDKPLLNIADKSQLRYR